MIPLVTPQEMAAVDSEAPEPVAVLIERAGAAVARAAVRLMGGTYGRRVVVLAGKGNNGNDGRAAARRLADRGVHVTVVDAASRPPVLPVADLVIDAAYGTGFRGRWSPPDPGSTPVLAVDIPSGVDGLTGWAEDGGALSAEHTVTFAALKPGLLLSPGRELAGSVEVADIGLDVSRARAHLVEQSDVAAWVPPRAGDAHKWRAALWLVAGSAGMLGAAHLAARSAQRAGAGMVRLSSPGVLIDPLAPTEVVGHQLPLDDWARTVLDDLERFHALVIGPGLGRDDDVGENTRSLVAKAPVPVVIDGDGLFALAWHADGARTVVAHRPAATVLTPHDGEFALLQGTRVGRDRFSAARGLAADLGCIVLLKGPVTIVADPGGDVLVTDTGDERLATAGTGDVLAGLLGALLAQRVPPVRAAAAAAWLHGRAARRGFARGLVAGDLPDLVPLVLEEL
ncbi:MAG: ADP-dependent NAD(P)H-hydrate dehydratase / NAD(P)H-hydrate epimerase [Acidimicrobiaceae bacterium]|jgi:NAD(P)H-hydrate epimerase|nr:ADP-dependent NAD(P)H-hydrate dehydratase / NAD(P)H-hydrate epimerase [Acidimicrobiaceae bacterium]